MPIQYIPPIERNLKTDRPNVVLFGNGFFHECLDWGDMLKKCVKDGITEKEVAKLLDTDYLLFADAAIETSDSVREEKYINAIAEAEAPSEKTHELMRMLTELPVDVFITTNYTYQIEQCLDSRFTADAKKGYVYQIGKKADRKDTKFLMHTFNRVSRNGKYVDVWHPHGELRRKKSLVLSHDEYGRFVTEVVNYNKERKRMADSSGTVRFSSWFDYLLYGNVYIIGFGASYTEFDFWWMLNRRMREENRELLGKYYFYEPLNEKNEAKHLILSKMDVEYRHLDCIFTEKSGDYNTFYEKATKDIESIIDKNKDKESSHE